MFFGRRRPTIGRRPLEAEFIRHACRPPAEGSAPIEIGLSRRCAPGVGLRRRKERFPGRRRPTVGRRPPEAEFIRHACRPPAEGSAPIEIGLFKALTRQASASADAKNAFPVGAGRPSAVGLRRPNSFGTHADRRPKALRRLKSASQGAARQASACADAKDFPGRRRPTVGRRPPEAEFIRRTCCRLQRCPAPPRGPRGPCAPLAPRGRSAAGSPPSPGAADPRAR
jgi:hypothetical protein